MKANIHFFLLSLIYVSDKSCRETQITNFMSNNVFLNNLNVYEAMWKNTVEPDRPQMAIRRIKDSLLMPDN
jgi:hypothetical protein